MKKIVICNKFHKHITDEDFVVLKLISPGLARNVKVSDYNSPTHFVCGKCGQVAPIKIKALHECQSVEDNGIAGDRGGSTLQVQ